MVDNNFIKGNGKKAVEWYKFHRIRKTQNIPYPQRFETKTTKFRKPNRVGKKFNEKWIQEIRWDVRIIKKYGIIE